MRLARPAAAGLGIGVLAGFCAALVKPRPPALPAEPSAHPATGVPTTGLPPSPELLTGAPRTLDATRLEARYDTPGRVV